MERGHLFIISGVSGVGKNSVLTEVLKDSDLNGTYSVSMTTRPKRTYETDGVNYFFVSQERFDQAIENNELLEWAEFCGNRYGTPIAFVNQQIGLGKNVIVEIEVKGALNVMKSFPEAISIFLLPPNLDELRRRLVARGTESDNVIDDRINEAKRELQFKDHYDHLVINDDLLTTIEKVKDIIKNAA